MKPIVLATLTLLAVPLLEARAAEPPTSTAAPATKPAETSTATPATPATEAKPAVEQIPAPPDVAAPPADAEKTASGLASKVLAPGTGTLHPGPSDPVKVDYTGWTTDGKTFDSTVVRGKPAILPLDRVITGWQEGLQLMVKGEKRRFWIPAQLAYEGRPNRPQGMLVFDVTLLEILKPPPAPPDVAAAPSDAQRTRSGLASKVLTPGNGTRHPKEGSVVKVHYTG